MRGRFPLLLSVAVLGGALALGGCSGQASSPAGRPWPRSRRTDLIRMAQLVCLLLRRDWAVLRTTRGWLLRRCRRCGALGGR